MNNNFQNDMELENMRLQMETLKKKLDQQEIVNDRLIRQSMKSKMSWIKKYLIFGVFVIPLAAFGLLPLIMESHISWWWYGFTLLFLTADVCADWYINSIPSDAFLKDNLVDTAQKLVRMKQLRRWSTIISFIILFFWIVWLFMELWFKQDESFMAIPHMIGAGIGLAIGIPIGLYIYFKMQRTNDEIIHQIEEITKED